MVWDPSVPNSEAGMWMQPGNPEPWWDWDTEVIPSIELFRLHMSELNIPKVVVQFENGVTMPLAMFL